MSHPPDAHDSPTLDTDSDTAAACLHPWCTTAHGSTTHPDDEDHRSAGTLISAVLRARDAGVYETEIEIGLLRRRKDDDTWLVLEDGEGVHLEMRLDTARRMAEVLREDPALSNALGPV